MTQPLGFRVSGRLGKERHPMSPTITEIAEAFSRHEFDRTFPRMDDDIEWAQIGEGHVQGKADVVTACERSSEYLAGVRTTFNRFKIVAAENCVVIDSRAEYVDAEGESSEVASCDIYDFIDGSLTAITTYAVEIDSSNAD
jgi:ketosteroid isomerase-like protein